MRSRFRGKRKRSRQNELVEIQLRTLAMDYWSVLEYHIYTAWILKTKKASAPHGTKAFASAIPPKLTSCDVHSLLRTIMRTPRITGGFPSDPTWENFPFKPPSEGHSHRCAPLRSHRPKLSWDALCCATLLPHRFVV